MTALEQRGRAILSRLPAGAVMAEVGVLRGRLSTFLLSHREDLTLVMVDNWLTADLQPASYRETGDEHAHHTDPARVASHKADALRAHRCFRLRSQIIEGNSVDVAAQFEGGHFDAVFLDADHSEAGVAADIAAWLPKVKPGGWIGGHDIDNDDPRFDFSGVRRAVDAHFPAVELGENFTWFARVE